MQVSKESHMKRTRRLHSLKECVNPEYLDAWGGRASVRDAIEYSIDQIAHRAYKRSLRHGRCVSIIFPNFNGKRSIVQHMYFTMREKLSRTECEIILGDEEQMSGDILVQLVPFTKERSRHCIPVGWHDDLDDWTWQDVIKHAEYYSTSSSDTWPPYEYLKNANPLAGQTDL